MAASVTPASQQRFQAAFREASKATGANFDFLMRTAARESGMNASAKAPTSSATGLFQFIEQTWLETMKEAGPQFGLGKYSQKITQVGDRFYVRDRAERQQILDLRKDPQISAFMAGAYAKKNEAQLAVRLNRQPSSGELYAAHFLGAQGGGRLIELAETKPNLAAHKIFPDQARANRNIFFERNGQPKTVAQVYQNLVATVPNDSPQQAAAKSVDALGDRFRVKVGSDRVPDQANAAMAQFFSQPSQPAEPAKPSRYGMGYAAEPSALSGPRRSRLVTPSVQGQEVNASVSTGGRSRFAPGAGEEAMPLPRSKPTKGGAYADLLKGAVPREKPQASGRAGALDLSSFLDKAALPGKS